eukprot:366554-Chlamydomonas_euryale.AAC.9
MGRTAGSAAHHACAAASRQLAPLRAAACMPRDAGLSRRRARSRVAAVERRAEAGAAAQAP